MFLWHKISGDWSQPSEMSMCVREGYIRDVYHMGFYSRPTSRLKKYYFKFIFLFFRGRFFSNLVYCPLCSLRGWAIQSLSHGVYPYLLLSSFFPNLGKLSCCFFFWPPSVIATCIFVNCHSALYCTSSYSWSIQAYLDVITGCSVTVCYTSSSLYLTRTTKLNRMVLLTLFSVQLS